MVTEKKCSRVLGFTLIELSISLVIIGLIVGGIVGARDLIQQAKLRAIMSDAEAYKTAINTFQLKYNGLPGDILNASSYWPSCDGTPANCNGNGNGQIGGLAVGGNEGVRAWQQLTDSGIVPGSYTGTGSGDLDIGINVPTSPIDGAGYALLYRASYPIFQRSGNVLVLGKEVTGAGSGGLWTAALSAADTKSIDDKIDDGNPSDGIFMASDNGTCTDGNANGDAPGSANYVLTSSEPGCQVWFWLEK